MSDRLVLSENAFFQASDTKESWTTLWNDCLTRKEAVSATLSKDRIVLRRMLASEGSQTIVLRGDWRVPGFETMVAGHTGVQLFVPYFFNICGIVLPHSLFANQGVPDRPIVDFFVRNLFSGLSTGATLLPTLEPAARRGTHIRKFQRHYHRIFRSHFPESVFDKFNALETADFILANGFARSLDFTDPLLAGGARHLRTLSDALPPPPLIRKPAHDVAHAKAPSSEPEEKRFMTQPVSNASIQITGSPALERYKQITGFPHHWQMPTATEKTAYLRLLAERQAPDFDYIGFPWATLIDGLRANASTLHTMLTGWKAIAGMRPTDCGRVATVAQHIHAGRFVRLFTACGVTDLFWTHATRSQPVIEGIRIHPFPHYPTQVADIAERVETEAPRPYLANFVGTYIAGVYLSETRARIFEDIGREKDLLIVKREAWHFQRRVYEEQMQDRAPLEAQMLAEANRREEYLDAIRKSSFTLCPTGSGPNSIRIGEALALGSIPIILSTDLALPGDLELWEATCLIEEDSETGYRRALERARAMPEYAVREKRRASQDLYAQIAPKAFGQLIVSGMARR